MRTLTRCLLSATMLAGAARASAEPLTDLLVNVCSSVPRIATTSTGGNCSSTPRGVRVKLTASRVPRSKPLPAIALPDGRSLRLYGALVYNGSLAPEMWIVKPGDTLEVALHDRLPPESRNKLVHLTNLHAHGLIVRPDLVFAGDPADPLRVTQAGDNVFACTAFRGRGRDCAHMAHMADRSAMDYRIVLPVSHPEGLFWYHPHLHGTSGEQVARGMAGLIGVQRSDALPAARTRYLMLKDLHVRNVVAAGAPGKVRGEVFYPEEIAPDGCSSDAVANLGMCATGRRSLWLFTVNGQVYPRLEFDASGGEIWHIANTSANATYLLRLRRLDTGQAIPVQALAKDGASIPQGEVTPARWVDEILMMPASRVSIYVRRPADMQQGTLAARLESAGFDTGATPGDGDKWPAVSLLDVVFGPGAAAVQMPREIAVPAPAAVQASGLQQATVEGSCPADSTVELAPDESRLVAFNIAPDGDAFLVGAGVIASNAAVSGEPLAWETLDVALGKAAAFQHHHAPQICARAGRRETWIIANPNTASRGGGSNKELHNFHIHQKRFKVLDVYTPPGAAFQMAADFWKDSYHDTFPVPSGGWIRIEIEFDATQIGDFVYHCHILEHEDGGMMAHMRVLP